jgi:hypothetical protein
MGGMAVMAGEAITEGGTAGMRGAAARRRRPRGQPRSRRVTRRTPIEGEAGGTQVETETYGPRPRRGGGYASQYGSQAKYVAGNAQLTPGRSTYQGAILAEFLVCIAILLLAPIASPQGGTGLSPYAVDDLKRFGALGVVFFGLALVPGENGSRVGAWLGFLVMLVTLMRAVNAGSLKSITDIFSQGGTQPPGATTGGTGSATGPPGVQTA